MVCGNFIRSVEPRVLPMHTLHVGMCRPRVATSVGSSARIVGVILLKIRYTEVYVFYQIGPGDLTLVATYISHL